MVFTPGEWLSHLVSDFHTCWVTFTPAEQLSHLLHDFHTCWMTFIPAERLSHLLNSFHTCCWLPLTHNSRMLLTRRYVLSPPWRPQLPPNGAHARTVYRCSSTHSHCWTSPHASLRSIQHILLKTAHTSSGYTTLLRTLAAQRGWQWTPCPPRGRWGRRRFLGTPPDPGGECLPSASGGRRDLENAFVGFKANFLF